MSATHSSAPAPAAAAAESLTATVRSVDPVHGTFEVVGGVGYALRVVRLVDGSRTAPGSKSSRSGVGNAARHVLTSDLHPGQIVRIHYFVQGDLRIATAIEPLGTLREGGTSAPADTAAGGRSQHDRPGAKP